MNKLELKAERIRNGYTSQDCADFIGVSRQTFHLKEAGRVKFSDDEKIKLVEMLHLSLEKFNVIFFDGKLPYDGRNERAF